MRLVNDVDGFLGRRQDHPAAQAQVREHEIVVRDHNERIFGIAARLVEGAASEEAASVARTAAVIRRHRRPRPGTDALLPRVQFAVPGALLELGEHPLVRGHILRFREFQQRLLGTIPVTPFIEPLETDVTPPPLGERKVEVEIRVALQVWQIAEDHLLLQRHGRRADKHPHAEGLGEGDDGQTVRDGLAGAGARFDHAKTRLATAQRAGDVSDHLPLTPARLETASFQPRPIRGLDQVPVVFLHGTKSPVHSRCPSRPRAHAACRRGSDVRGADPILRDRSVKRTPGTPIKRLGDGCAGWNEPSDRAASRQPVRAGLGARAVRAFPQPRGAVNGINRDGAV